MGTISRRLDGTARQRQDRALRSGRSGVEATTRIERVYTVLHSLEAAPLGSVLGPTSAIWAPNELPLHLAFPCKHRGEHVSKSRGSP
jgi:hypothetical protein